MSAAEIAELASDIRRDGLLEKIKLWRGPDGVTFLVDGRSRLRALESLGLKPSVEQHTTSVSCKAEEIATLIVGLNVHRRMLSARQKIELTLAAMKAGEEFHPRMLVSRIASATQLSKQTVYSHRDLLPEGSYREQRSVGPAIMAALADPSKIPDSPPRKNGHGGKPRSLARRVALHLGVATQTVERHLAQPSNGNGNGNGNECRSAFNPDSGGKRRAPTVVIPEEKHLTDEDRTLAKAVRTLQGVSGADLTEWGLAQLRIAGDHLARIKREYAQEAEVEHDVMAEAATPA